MEVKKNRIGNIKYLQGTLTNKGVSRREKTFMKLFALKSSEGTFELNIKERSDDFFYTGTPYLSCCYLLYYAKVVLGVGLLTF